MITLCWNKNIEICNQREIDYIRMTVHQFLETKVILNKKNKKEIA